MLLKVMAGDRFNLRATSWWKSPNVPGTTANPLSDIVTALISGVPGASGGKVGVGQLTGTILNPGVIDFLNGRDYNNTRPRAYLNWILLD